MILCILHFNVLHTSIFNFVLQQKWNSQQKNYILLAWFQEKLRMLRIEFHPTRILPTSRYYKDHPGSSKPFHHNLLLLGCWLWYYNIPSHGWKVCERIVDCNAMTRLGHLKWFEINVTGVPKRFKRFYHTRHFTIRRYKIYLWPVFRKHCPMD